jgi:hypothetical protein
MFGFKRRQNNETDAEYLQMKLNLAVSVMIIISNTVDFAKDA